MVSKFDTNITPKAGSASGGNMLLTIGIMALIAYLGYKFLVKKPAASEENK